MFAKQRGGMMNKPPGPSPRVRKTARSQVEVNAAQRTKDRAKVLRQVDKLGPMPAEPSRCFTLFNKQFYNIDVRHLVSCKVPPGHTGDLELAEGMRQRRRLMIVNAGTPRSHDPDAGKAFHGTYERSNEAPDEEDVLTLTEWAWPMLPTEAFDCCWLDPLPPVAPGETRKCWVRDPMRVCDPFHDYELGDEPMYSHADVLARYMGHKALCTPSTTAFTNYVMNMDSDLRTGKPILADNETTLWDDQRRRVSVELGKIYLLYPRRVGPCLDEDGNPFPEGEIEAAHLDGRAPVPLARPPDDDERRGQAEAPQPVVFASILSDRRPGKPGCSIAKWHDKTRAWMLPPSHVEQIKRIVWHYRLEAVFPALADMHPKRSTALLDLDAHREAAFAAIGPAPEPKTGEVDLVPSAWLAARADAPFGKVWVQHCSRANPSGALEFGTGKPLIVPLLKDRAEERNGVPWLDVDEIDRGTAEGEGHYAAIQTALGDKLGKAWHDGGGGAEKGRGRQKRKATAEPKAPPNAKRTAPRYEDLLKLHDQLQRKHDWALARIGELETKGEAHHMTLYDTGSKPGLVDFIDGADAKCILRWNRGTLRIDQGKGTPPINLGTNAGMLKVRFLADVDDAPLPELDLWPADAEEAAEEGA